MTIAAWITSILGFAIAFVLSLAGAMKTVPMLSAGEALAGVPVALLGLLLSLNVVYRHMQARRHARMILLGGIPLAIAALALFIVYAGYFHQPG